MEIIIKLAHLCLKAKYYFVRACFCREGNEPGDELTVTYRELLNSVCRFANVLKSQGTFGASTFHEPICND